MVYLGVEVGQWNYFLVVRLSQLHVSILCMSEGKLSRKICLKNFDHFPLVISLKQTQHALSLWVVVFKFFHDLFWPDVQLFFSVIINLLKFLIGDTGFHQLVLSGLFIFLVRCNDTGDAVVESTHLVFAFLKNLPFPIIIKNRVLLVSLASKLCIYWVSGIFVNYWNQLALWIFCL